MYTPLYVKTDYELLTNIITVKNLIEKALEYNISSIGICNNNLNGTMDFYIECIKNHIKPIIGLEVLLKDKDNTDRIILLYAKNINGYKNLIKLNNIQNEKIITGKDLIKYKSDIVCIVPRSSSFYYKTLTKIFKDIYVGYSNIQEYNELKKVKNIVFINKVLVLNKEDSKYLKYVNMIRDGLTIDNYNNIKYNNNYLLDYDEVSKITSNTNTNEIVKLCDIVFETIKKPNLPKYTNKDEKEFLKNLCFKGLSKRLKGNVNDKYIDRLNYELETIDNMGFCNYFLIVYDFIRFAKTHDIMVGPGRGSAAGSLVAYTLGITEIDPLKYNLLFERFLNSERVTMPDIDTDFQFDKRDDVINYVKDKYGIKRCANIITYGTLSAKAVIRDVARTLNISLKLVDRLTKNMSDKTTLKKEYENNNMFKNIVDQNNELKKLYDIAIHLEGIKRHSSIHAAGVVISGTDLDEVIPLVKNNDSYLTGYTMQYLEDLGLLKMDFLGLKNLTIISDVKHDVENKHNIKLDLNNLPLNDKKTLYVFYSVNTLGIFQFEGEGIKNFLRSLKVTSFDDIVASIALFRPGPMDFIPTYIKRKHKEEKVSYIDENLEPILKDTYGIIIYQEQIMQIAQIFANLSLGEADILRRAISKKKIDIIKSEEKKFIDGAIKNGYSSDIAKKIYNMIEKFANYGFNKSHSVAYSYISYQMAYLKAHYPSFFITNLLNSVVGSIIKTKEYIMEAKINKIKIISPNINLSTDKYIAYDNSIVLPLTLIGNVGNVVSHEIVEKREEGFKDFYDFMKKCYSKTVNREVIESMIYASCFDIFKINKKTLINNLDSIIDYVDLTYDLEDDDIDKPKLILYDEYSDEEILEHEFATFGFYLNSHPLDKYKSKSDINTTMLKKYISKNINIKLIIDDIHEIETKKKDKMAFIKCIDEYDSVDLTLFPKTYEKYTNLEINAIIDVYGKVEVRNDKIQIIVDKITVL